MMECFSSLKILRDYVVIYFFKSALILPFLLLPLFLAMAIMILSVALVLRHQSLGVGQRSMRELLSAQDGGQGVANESSSGAKASEAASSAAEVTEEGDSPLGDEEVEGIMQRTAKFLLGEGR